MTIKIRTKLLVGFGLILSLTFIVGLFSLSRLTDLSDKLRDLYAFQTMGVSYIKEANITLANRRRLLRELIIDSDPQRTESLISEAKQLEQRTLELLTKYRSLIQRPKAREVLHEVQVDMQAYTSIEERLIAAVRARNLGAAREALAAGKPISGRIIANMDLLAKIKEEVAKAAAIEGQHTFERARMLVWALLLLAIALGTGIGYFLSRQIAQGLSAMAKVADGISKGELDQTLTITTRDELADMARSFQGMVSYLKEVARVADAMSRGDLTQQLAPKSDRDQFGLAISQMIASLRDVVSRVRSASDGAGAGSVQLSSTSSELSRTVAVQASSAEETSAAMEEMAANIKAVDERTQILGTKVVLLKGQSDELAAAVAETGGAISELAASIQQVSGHVSHANTKSEQASKAALAGDQAVHQTLEGMQAIAETMHAILESIRRLEQRSGEIGAIVEVIDDIADQTNLLALNAAIEAARAGDHGRGFAVVAAEVTKLAERSSLATKEIAELITGIQKETTQAVGITQQGATKVEEGVQRSNRTGQALVQITEAVREVTSLLNEVSAAIHEQARASSQIVATSEQMAGVNRQVMGAVSEMEGLTRGVAYATAEQAQGTDQVVMAVESLSRSSQEAASATEQVARTADDLNQQAHHLQETVAFFNLGQTEREAVVRIGAAHRPSLLAVGS